MRRLLTSILALLVAIIGGLCFVLLATEPGLRLIWSRLHVGLPEGIEVESVSGRLIGPLTVRGFVLEIPSTSLRVDSARVDWAPAGLLGRVVMIRAVTLDGVEVIWKKAEDNQVPFTLPQRLDSGWALSIADLRASRIAVRPGAESRPVVIDDVELAGRFGGTRLTLGRLSARSADFELEGSGRLETRGDFPVEALFQWQTRLEGYPRLSGRTRLAGSLRELNVGQTLSAPWMVTGEFTLKDLFEDLRIEGRLSATEVDPRDLGLDTPVRILNADIDAEGSLHDLGFQARVRVAHPSLGSAVTDLKGSFRRGTLYVDSLETGIPGQSARVTGKGEIDLSDPSPRVAASLEWADLSWPATGDTRLSSPEGRMSVAGVAESYRFSGAGQLESPGYPSTAFEVEGGGDRDSLELGHVRLAALDGVIEGAGSLRWRPTVQAEISVNGSDIDPGGWLPEWPGRLALQGRVAARMDQGRLDLDVPEMLVTGRVLDHPVRILADARYGSEELDIRSFLAQSGGSRIEVGGRVGQTFDLSWKIESPDLGEMLPDAGGSLAASGTALGSLDQPLLTAAMRGDRLAYGDARATSLKVDARIDMSGNSPSDLALELLEASAAGVDMERGSLTGAGTPGAHTLKFSAVTGLATAEIEGTGQVAQDRWNYRLTQATLAPGPLEPLTLQGVATGQIGRDVARIDQSCWASGAAKLCVTGSWTPSGYGTDFTIESLPAAYFASWLPPDLSIESIISGAGRLAVSSGMVTGAALHLTSGSGGISTVTEDGESLQVLAFDPGELHLDFNRDGLRLSAALPLADQGGLIAEAAVGAGALPLLERPLTGRMTAELRDIRVLNRLVPELDHIEGRVDGSVLLAGTLQQPALTGALALREGTAKLDRPGLTLRDLNIELAGQGSGTALIHMRARSGEGALEVKGTAELLADPMRFELMIEGDDVQVLDTPEARLSASPELLVTMVGKRLQVNGQITVPRGSIEPKQLPTTAVSVSTDQILVDESAAPQPTSPLELDARIRLLIKDKVKFSGFGLKGRFEGNLLVIDKPGRPTEATGELSILDGTYRAYGQNLEIQTGRLLFAGGPVTEPGVDVEAVRRPDAGVLVGIRARGELKQPAFTLFSDPPMSESDQLSYLVLGRPMERQATAEEQTAMNQAAVGLGLAGGALLGEQLGEKLGVDELTVGSGPGETTSEQASLLVGKYLSPKLYVSYGLGLFEPVSTFRMRYLLSSKWVIIGETSALRSGADFFYVIERGD